tara:strand:+ start:195 stop:533 length:339 start_codon:yes stop_codon:yes gene_type:complete
MTYILIALVASSFIFEYWLLTKIRKLDKENKMHRKSLQKALEALARDGHNFQAGISRDTKSQKDELLIEVKRINKRVDVLKRDIINSLPTQIRKTIGHIEFAKPLDNSHGRG